MKTIAFLHGFMGDPSDWDEIREGLLTIPTAAPRIRPAANWDAGIQQVLAELPDRCVIAGYSMGARLALGCVTACPERFDGLVFISGSPGIEDADRSARKRHDEQVASRLQSESRQEFLSVWYQQPVFSSLSDSIRRDEVQRKIDRDGSDWPDIIRAYSVAVQPDFWPLLADLRQPTLVMAGSLDRKYAQTIARMGQVIPKCTVDIVPEAGHIIHREKADLVISAIQRFMLTLPR